MKDRLVKNWMTKAVISVKPKARMLDAHKLMRENNIRRVPVVKGGKVVRIVTRSDIREAEPSDATTLNVWEVHYLLAKLEVRDIMSKDVVTLHEDDTIKKAAQLMNSKKIGGLPVVDDHNRLIGIITESDVFRILITWFNEEEEEEA